MASCSYIILYISIYFCHFANGGTHVNLYNLKIISNVVSPSLNRTKCVQKDVLIE